MPVKEKSKVAVWRPALPMTVKVRAERLCAAAGVSAVEGVLAWVNEAIREKRTPKVARRRSVRNHDVDRVDSRHVHPATPNAETMKVIEDARAGRGLIKVTMEEMKRQWDNA